MDLPDLTAKPVDLDGDTVALVHVTTGTQITYAGLDDRASRLAEFLRDDWVVTRGSRLTDAEAVGLVTDDDNATVAAQLRHRVNGEHGLLRALALADSALDCETTYDDALAQASGRQIQHAPREESDLRYLMYTSGTTGRPKGVVQTAGMALVNYLNIGITTRVTGDDVFRSVQMITATWASMLPNLRIHDVDGVNHYTIVMSTTGADAVSVAIRRAMVGGFSAQ